MGSGADRCVDVRVYEQNGSSRTDGLEHLAGKVGESIGRKVFFAKLNKFDSLCCPERGLANECCLSFGFYACPTSSVGDGAAKHADKCKGFNPGSVFMVRPSHRSVVAFRQGSSIRRREKTGLVRGKRTSKRRCGASAGVQR